ncbi:hypothetical protein OR1_04199 [Geobacter sp. OR-1]|nr:hypothetical protein OR1_04199 [Geobacter sp. OR-1]
MQNICEVTIKVGIFPGWCFMKTNNTDYERGYKDGYEGKIVNLQTSIESEDYKRGYKAGCNAGCVDDMVTWPDDWWWM